MKVYNVAIVEDDEVFTKQVNDFLLQYSKSNDIHFNIYNYTNGSDFLNQADINTLSFVLMDIDMPVLNGIETATKLRQSNQSLPLIFITSLAQYAIKGYEVKAFDYILKPINFYSFTLKLQRLLNNIYIPDEKIIIKTAGKTSIISVSSVYYIEVTGHTLHYFTTQGDYQCTGKSSFRILSEKLKPFGFSRCNNYTIINLHYASKGDSDFITINNKSISISDSKKKDFYKDLMDFIK